ncbi:FtsX-like permease family protein [Flexivirga oryzae]|uniref:Putative ABC transport system permease protein n=1 Tax=Flexivirga oryzae TaxID=1794944 RepID=A0A839N9H9_9MICO|nr:FtsX-like permease family protein [Flexivirga oryzae]MBB2892833.1 putative ABC transport system permease protein [Flexivirga oryzae]
MTRLATVARRSRRGQSLLFTVTVCLLVAVAAADPLLTRSFRSALVAFHTHSLGPASLQIQYRYREGADLSMASIRRKVDPRVRAVTGPPIDSRTTVISWPRRRTIVRLQFAVAGCAHVHVVAGRCPTARNEIMVSSAQLQAVINPSLRLGERLTVKGIGDYSLWEDLNPQKQLTVVGVFTARANDPFWGGQHVAAYNGDGSPAQPGATWLTADATFAGHPPVTPVPKGNDTSPDISWSGIYNTVGYPIRVDHVGPDSLARAVAGLRATTKRLGTDADVTEPLSTVYADTRTDLRQVGQILPYLLLQLLLVLLILLVQVSTYLATVRRGEAAVLKMRGNGSAGVVRLGAADLLPSWVLGSVAGLALAYAVDELVRRTWLPGSVHTAWNWTSIWAAAAVASLVAAVWVGCWWLMAREPIGTLLRSRPVRRRGLLVSTPAAVLASVCLVGVVLTATRSLTGAPVQVTPVLLAGLVALVVGALLAPAAAWLVRFLLARRRAAAALAIAQLGRRAGTVTAVATLIITSALLTLSVSEFARGADNRAARTASDLGSAAVVRAIVGSGTVDGQSLIDAVDSIDPQHRRFTPAVQINSSTPTSNAVLGVLPADLARIGARTGLPSQVPWAALERGGPASRPNALAPWWTTSAAAGSTVSAPTMADADGGYRVVGGAPYIPGAGARTIVVNLATMLRVGDRQDNVSFQVFSATEDPKQLARLGAALRKAGFASAQVQTSTQVRAGYDATATAWAMRLSIVVSALSVLAALVSVVLVAVASRAERRRDLRALRTGGVSDALLRRATVAEFAVLTLLGSVIGALTAPLAAWLTGQTMLWWSTPPDAPVTRTGFQWHAGSFAAAGLILLLALVGAGLGMRLARAAGRSQRRRTA